ncbi:MAG: glycoside hydrolase family 3 protein [Catenibacterium mitsuokai]|nr:glycoside hydrolase family 3 protein [Catenibacterium mitsuokai]MEE0082359.1 glycoside hydrolase family 3 protein [Catenibacterium mitsuokai]
MKKVSAIALSTAMALSMALPSKVNATSRVDQLLSNMSTRQKITQMLMVDFRYWDEDLSDGAQTTGHEFTKMNDQVRKIVEDYDFGALIYFAQNIQETEQSYNLSMAMQKAATKDGGIPLLISADQEGGNVYRLGSGTALPGNMALGATHNTEYAKKAGQIIGSELSSIGINTNLAPVVDVNNNANNPVIGLRSYSDDADLVGNMASATIAGLKDYNVIGCAKHFPGHGDTATDSHYGLPIVNKSKSELLNNELKPYKIAINQGIEMIMTAHILYPQLDNTTVVSEKTGNEEKKPATMSKAIITDLLKGEMGFKGVVSTDAMNMKAIADTFGESQAVKLAIEAGADLICMPTVLYNQEDVKKLDTIIDYVEDAVKKGEISESRLDDGCRRILTVKENRGILDWKESDFSLNKALSTVGSATNRATEREIAAAAVTVVKNENNTLPVVVKENQKILMLCPYDNERAQMIMAYNRAKEAGLIPDSAEVKVVRYNGSNMDAVKGNIDWADTVFVNSEISAASRFSSNHWLYSYVEGIVDYTHEKGKKSIVMSVDKPYDVQMYANADAILAVYGCKGSSVDVTEAIVGGVTSSKAAYGPNIIAGIEVALGTFGAQGTLPVNIPVYDKTAKLYTDTIKYKRGYGISYKSLLNKDTLNDLIAKADALDSKKYTEESWNKFTPALAGAKEVANTNGVSQKKIDEAIASLQAAMDALVEKPAETKPEEPKKDDTKKDETKKDETNKDETKKDETKKDNVKTGDMTNILPFAALMGLACVAFIFLKKKKA